MNTGDQLALAAQVAIHQADAYAVCERGTCKECDVLYHILDTLTDVTREYCNEHDILFTPDYEPMSGKEWERIKSEPYG